MNPLALEHAFLEDIVAHPEDPTLWLILADWLEERDDPRSELVRSTWSLTYEREHPEFASRQARVQALVAGGMIPVVPRRTFPPDFEFAWIPPGTFHMGSPEDESRRYTDEHRHQVTLTRGFWIGVYPVTQGQWRTVMGNNPSHFARGGTSAVNGFSAEVLDRFPVERVFWDDAREFCVRLGERLGRGCRLPTEAEWEYACRAGTTTAFYFGPTLNGLMANCSGSTPYGSDEKGPELRHPTVVGSYPPNARGLYDMSGNVYEWCEDFFRVDYQNLPAVDPLAGVHSDQRRVMRGGSWSSSPEFCRSAYRDRIAADERNLSVGCRVVLCQD